MIGWRAEIFVQHLVHRLMVALVLCNTRQHLDGLAQGPQREYIGDGVAALVRRSQNGVCWSWGALVVAGALR